MSKMKDLLRKLHIGGGINDDHQRLAETRPVTSPNSNPNPPSSSSTPSSLSSSAASTSGSTTMGRIGAVDSVGGDRAAGDSVGGGGCMDFNFLEEEFQVQLALAISASDPKSREDPESAQIDAAKRISLGCSSSGVNTSALVDNLSLRYWNYNFVNYDEQVVDGFYDVYCITSNSLVQGKLPLLVDLLVESVSNNVDYEVILVNRLVDSTLLQFEERAYAIFLESQVSGHGSVLSGLIQKIADIVVDRMGGPVSDADEMSKAWAIRRFELQSSLKSIILPLGSLDVGLSRHRALLFKVLADRINLPCMLVKGSYYTGTDDGAVNLIKIENGSEYIIDLMGAPGTLIPAEVPSSQLPSSFLGSRSFPDVTVVPTGPRLLHDGAIGTLAVSNFESSIFEPSSLVNTSAKGDERSIDKQNQIEISRIEFDQSIRSLHRPYESSHGRCGKSSSEQKKKVKNVSKYVISAAKDPEFAQKLHAVLLESGASPPLDLFSDISPQELVDEKVLQQVVEDQKNAAHHVYYQSDKSLSINEHSLINFPGMEHSDYFNMDSLRKQIAGNLAKKQSGMETHCINSKCSPTYDATSGGFILVDSRTSEISWSNPVAVDRTPANQSNMEQNRFNEEEVHADAPYEVASSYGNIEIYNLTDDKKCFKDELNFKVGKESPVKLMETDNSNSHIGCNSQSEKLDPMFGEVAEWEIPWEDLRIGERIGIGSCGEVYRADWNGTEVAVKKFLDQDFSGDALVQFKYEVEIMLRMRHPNVVLFMGAVTCHPHFSILTEFLPRGSLYRLLHRPNIQLDEKRRMRMALDVAKGMNYLHTSHPTIVHRDLKSPNLLVDKNWVVKVCDFGLSRMKHHTFLSSKSTAGTPEWMAPEVLRNEPANEKCDVYSFGVILWELTTCRIPWKGLNPMQVVGAVGFQNRRLEIPEETDPVVAQIIRDCWQREPNLRPSFSQLMLRLRRLQQLLVEGSTSAS